jgi:hypothetical protein
MQPDEAGGVFVVGPTQPDPLMLYQLGEYHYQQGQGALDKSYSRHSAAL